MCIWVKLNNCKKEKEKKSFKLQFDLILKTIITRNLKYDQIKDWSSYKGIDHGIMSC